MTDSHGLRRRRGTPPTALVGAALLALVAVAPARASDPADLRTAIAGGLPLEIALKAAQASLAACATVPVSAVVTDSGGELRVALAKDTGRPIFTDLAWRKARTAAHFKEPSSVTAERSKTDAKTFFQLSPSTYSYYGGGVPLFAKGAVVGAVAVSGGLDPPDDERCANAGARAAQALLGPP